jgi:hypothetical protein
MRVKPIILAVGLLAVALPAWAHDYSLDECREGSDFIRNAALSRDNGIPREEFLGRMRSDIDLIQAFPPELRWFVQDEEDEVLLIGHASQVFDDPRAPESHQATFLAACVERLNSADATSTSSRDAAQDVRFGGVDR